MLQSYQGGKPVEIDPEKVRELAAALTTIQDMAVLLGVSEFELREWLHQDRLNENIYRRTLAEIALEIRQRYIELAAAGSPTAAEQVDKYLQQIILEQ